MNTLEPEKNENSTVKYIKSLFKLKKENETITDKIIRNIKTLFEEEDDYYKPARVGYIWNNYYIEY